MLKNILFLLPLIASCNTLTRSIVYNMDAQGGSKGDPCFHKIIFEEDEYRFNETALKRFQLWYIGFILSPEESYNPDKLGIDENSDACGHLDNPELVILDLYNYVDQYSKLPLLGPSGKRAADKAREVWKQGKQIFGREEEIFSKEPESLALIRQSCIQIPEEYKQRSLKMILELVDRLFEMRPEKYEKLSKRLTHFEQSISQELKQANPTYNDEMAYLKKLLMEHFNDIDEEAFSSDFYSGFLSYSLPFKDPNNLIRLAYSSGSELVTKDFLDFLTKKGINIDLKDAVLSGIND